MSDDLLKEIANLNDKLEVSENGNKDKNKTIKMLRTEIGEYEYYINKYNKDLKKIDSRIDKINSCLKQGKQK